MKITSLPVDVRRLLHNALLVAVSPFNAYSDGKRTENVAGYRYTVLLPNLAYEKINVKILGDQMLALGDDAIPVKFEGAVAKIYCLDGKYDITVTAESIAEVKAAAGKPQA